MTKKVEQAVNEYAEIYALGSQISRSTVAVIDALTGRGAFKGEELTTIGQLRDQCLQAIQIAEHNQQEQMAQSD